MDVQLQLLTFSQLDSPLLADLLASVDPQVLLVDRPASSPAVALQASAHDKCRMLIDS